MMVKDGGKKEEAKKNFMSLFSRFSHSHVIGINTVAWLWPVLLK